MLSDTEQIFVKSKANDTFQTHKLAAIADIKKAWQKMLKLQEESRKTGIISFPSLKKEKYLFDRKTDTINKNKNNERDKTSLMLRLILSYLNPFLFLDNISCIVYFTFSFSIWV